MNLHRLPERLEQEREGLKALAEQSSIFSFSESGDLPGEFNLSFRGRGYCWRDRANRSIELTEEHCVRLKLSDTYPTSPPVVEWETAAMHPSLNADDLMSWKDLRVNWDPKMNLDLICERIWDLIRGAEEVDPRKWENCIAEQAGEAADWKLPADSRRLRDQASGRMTNVIHYRRKNGNSTPSRVTLTRQAVPCPSDSRSSMQDGIQFIDGGKPNPAGSEIDEQIWFLDE